jgi:hypothetical protein
LVNFHFVFGDLVPVNSKKCDAGTKQRPTGNRRPLIEAVRGGWVAIDEACQRYNLSIDEFVAWERDIDRNGVPGLRTTRYQIYRDTDPRRGVAGL